MKNFQVMRTVSVRCDLTPEEWGLGSSDQTAANALNTRFESLVNEGKNINEVRSGALDILGEVLQIYPPFNISEVIEDLLQRTFNQQTAEQLNSLRETRDDIQRASASLIKANTAVSRLVQRFVFGGTEN